MTSLGEKLQTVHQRVNTKLGTQDSSVVFKTPVVTKSEEFGRAYESVEPSELSLPQGVKIRKIKAKETDRAGTIKVDDLKVTIPGSLITEAVLKNKNTVLTYNSDDYAIKSFAPTDIISGVVVQWVVIARKKV